MGEPTNIETAPVEAPPHDSGLGFAGLARVFYEPAAFFARLKNDPKILVPYVTLGVLVLIFFIMIADLSVQMTLAAMREKADAAAIVPTAEQLKFVTIGGGAIVLLFPPLIAALLAMFWGNFIMAGQARFKQLLSVMLYGEVIYAVGLVVTGLLMVYKKSMFVSLSLAMLLPTPTSVNHPGVLYTFLSKFSIFNIWELIALGIGLSVIYGFSRNKGYLLSVLSMGILSLLQVATTAIF